MKIMMLRHGATKGNLEGRYVGCTDESITEESVEALKQLYREKYRLLKRADRVYVSPMLRCMETADILFPDRPGIVIQDFRECDFGEFEYFNYRELKGNPDYQAYIDSNGETGFPKGETRAAFSKRCVRAFCKVLKDLAGEETLREQECVVALVVHGGTIMSILDAFSVPHKDYFDWQVKNGQGFFMDIVWENQICRLENIEKI